VDVTGAVIGAVALLVFAIVAEWALARSNPFAAVLVAGLIWLGTAVAIYTVVVRMRKPSATR